MRMDLFLVTHPEPESASSNDLLFVSIGGRLIPLTRSAVARLAIAHDRETTAAAPPAKAAAPTSPAR
jgi:hypothetical protein